MRGLIVVTGGARGIGAAICLELAQEGYSVAVNYASNEAAARATVDSIRTKGGIAEAFAADVADASAVAQFFKESIAALGPLVGLVNNAGVGGRVGRIDEQEPRDLERVFAVNVLGSIFCAKEAVLRLSTKRGGAGGAIVNISSVAARLANLPGLVPYSATKGAIESFTRGLALEVAQEGIRVNAVAPGMTATDLTTDEMRNRALAGIPMGRIGEPAEIAKAVIWLMSPAAAYVTGTSITVSGGR